MTQIKDTLRKLVRAVALEWKTFRFRQFISVLWSLSPLEDGRCPSYQYTGSVESH